MMKTRSLMMKKCRNLKNEVKTRWGDSINLLYCSHIINKSRRSDDLIATVSGIRWWATWRRAVETGPADVCLFFFPCEAVLAQLEKHHKN